MPGTVQLTVQTAQDTPCHDQPLASMAPQPGPRTPQPPTREVDPQARDPRPPDPQRQLRRQGSGQASRPPPPSSPTAPKMLTQLVEGRGISGGWKTQASNPQPKAGPTQPLDQPMQPLAARDGQLPVKAAPPASAHTPLTLGVTPGLSSSPWSPCPSRLASGEVQRQLPGLAPWRAQVTSVPWIPPAPGGPEGAAHGPGSLNKRLASGNPQMAQSGQGLASGLSRETTP